MTHAFLLVFTICSLDATPATSWGCEEGEVRAASCVAAEAFVRAGLRVGQTLHVQSCGEAP